MRTTVALIRKDMWLFPFLCVCNGLATWALLSAGYERLFVLPSGRGFDELFLVLAASAVALGAFAALHEDVAGTRDWLQHRPVSPERAFWVRALACVGVVLAWPILGTAIVMLNENAFGKGLGCTDLRRLEGLAAVSADALTFFALGLFALVLPVFLAVRLLVLAVAILVVPLIASWFDSLMPGLGIGWLGHVSIRLLLTTGLLAASAVCNRHRFDPDLPPHRSSLIAGVSIVLAITYVCGEFGASCFEFPGLVALARRRPMVMRVAQDELALVSPRNSYDGVKFDVLDSALVRDGRVLARGEGLVVPRPSFGGRPERFDYYGSGRPWTRILKRGQRGWLGRYCTLEPGDKTATVLDIESEARRCWSLERPQDARSDEAFLLLGGTTESELERDPFAFEGYRDTEIVLVDPKGGGVHFLSTEGPPTWTPAPLPDGDRPRRKDEELLHDSGQLAGVEGEKGRWVRLGGEWRAATSLGTDAAMTMDVFDPDPLGPEIEVRTKDGPRFRHRFTLVTTDDRIFASIACIGALLLPAPSALLASLHPVELEGLLREHDGELLSVRASWWPYDPLLSLGHAWLLAPNLGLTAGLMALTFRTLRRRGASNRRAFFWAGSIFFSGVLGILVRCAFEPKRAWHRAELSGAEPTRIRAA